MEGIPASLGLGCTESGWPMRPPAGLLERRACETPAWCLLGGSGGGRAQHPESLEKAEVIGEACRLYIVEQWRVGM